MKNILAYFTPAPARPAGIPGEALDRKYRRLRLQQVAAMLVVYAMFYVCRLAFSATKKMMVDQGAYTARELGFVGSAMLIAYALGKATNGFLADRANVKRFIGFGLFVSAAANFLVGFHLPAAALTALWFVNGFAQATGAPCCVVGQSRWFAKKERGTYYGIWSCSNNLGEALAYVLTAYIMVWAGKTWGADAAWRSGFWGASLMGLAGIGIVALFFKDSPQSEGLPPVEEWRGGGSAAPAQSAAKQFSAEEVKRGQKIAIASLSVWLVALAGAFFAASRYAIIDWGIFFLEAKKGYSTGTASWIVTINSIVGAVSSGLSGFVSDKLFKGSRHELALTGGLLNITGLSLMMFVPGQHLWVDVAAMTCFGLAAGILLTFLGGLMAVDLVPACAAGAALGIAGMGNYIGAGIQSATSGFLIKPIAAVAKTLDGGAKLLEDGSTLLPNGRLVDAAGNAVNRFYSFDFHIAGFDFTVDWIAVFWVGMAVLSTVCALGVWRIAHLQGKTNTQKGN